MVIDIIKNNRDNLLQFLLYQKYKEHKESIYSWPKDISFEEWIEYILEGL